MGGARPAGSSPPPAGRAPGESSARGPSPQPPRLRRAILCLNSYKGIPPYSGYAADHYVLSTLGTVLTFANTPAWRGEHGKPHTGAVPVAGGALATGAPPAAAARRTATSRTLGSATATARSRRRHRSRRHADAGGRREGQDSRGSTPRSRTQPRPTRRRSGTSTPWTST